MIFKKLLHLEKEACSDPASLMAIHSIRSLLSNVDSDTEFIPMESPVKFINLLFYIKGCELNPDEARIALRLIHHKQSDNYY